MLPHSGLHKKLIALLRNCTCSNNANETGTSWSNKINCNFCSPAYSERTIEPALQKQKKKIGPKSSIFYYSIYGIYSARLSKVFTREKTSATDNNCTVVPGAFKKESC